MHAAAENIIPCTGRAPVAKVSEHIFADLMQAERPLSARRSKVLVLAVLNQGEVLHPVRHGPLIQDPVRRLHCPGDQAHSEAIKGGQCPSTTETMAALRHPGARGVSDKNPPFSSPKHMEGGKEIQEAPPPGAPPPPRGGEKKGFGPPEFLIGGSAEKTPNEASITVYYIPTDHFSKGHNQDAHFPKERDIWAVVQLSRPSRRSRKPCAIANDKPNLVSCRALTTGYYRAYRMAAPFRQVE